MLYQPITATVVPIVASRSDDSEHSPDDCLTIRGPDATVGKSDDYRIWSDDYLTIESGWLGDQDVAR